MDPCAQTTKDRHQEIEDISKNSSEMGAYQNTQFFKPLLIVLFLVFRILIGFALLTLYLILSLIFFSLACISIADPNRPSAIKTLLTNTHLILNSEFTQPVKKSFKDALQWMGDTLISFLSCCEGYWRICPRIWRKMHILVGSICIYLWIVGTIEIIDIFFVGYFLMVTSFFLYYARLPIWWYDRRD